MSEYGSIDELSDGVDEQGGVLSLQMGVVRDAYGAARLGSIVRENISNALAGKGLHHYPDELPDSQSEWIRLYRVGSNAGDLISAVLAPGESGDESIQKVIEADASEVLKRVRELVN